MSQQEGIDFRRLECLVADLTRLIVANKEQAAATAAQVAALKIQVSEVEGKLKTAMETIKEIQKEKQETQESEDDIVLFDDGLPDEFWEEWHDRSMN